MTNDTAIQMQNQRCADRAYWLSVYRACGLHKLKDAMTFAEFRQDPWKHLEDAGQGGAPASMDAGYEPLLPAQAAVAQRLDDLDAIESYFARQSEIQGHHQGQKQAGAQSLPDMIPLTAFARRPKQA